SSDVCSSDLVMQPSGQGEIIEIAHLDVLARGKVSGVAAMTHADAVSRRLDAPVDAGVLQLELVGIGKEQENKRRDHRQAPRMNRRRRLAGGEPRESQGLPERSEEHTSELQ